MKIILIILLVLIFILLINKKENYTNVDKNKKSNGIIQGSEPLQGQLFDDVIMYIGDKTLQGELGLEKCIKKCDGMCVEYGMTGDAFCFPNNNDQKKFTETIQSEIKNELF